MEIDTTITQVPAPPQLSRRAIWPWVALAGAVLLFLVCWGCWKAISGFRGGGADADAAVDRFHASLNSERYEDIYASTDDLFRRTTPHDSAIELFEGIHRKLGDAGSATRTFINFQANLNGRFVSVQYDTAFSSGPAHESFIWSSSSGGLRLAGYNVNSSQLLK